MVSDSATVEEKPIRPPLPSSFPLPHCSLTPLTEQDHHCFYYLRAPSCPMTLGSILVCYHASLCLLHSHIL